jgi:hypothetical protein
MEDNLNIFENEGSCFLVREECVRQRSALRWPLLRHYFSSSKALTFLPERRQFWNFAWEPNSQKYEESTLIWGPPFPLHYDIFQTGFPRDLKFGMGLNSQNYDSTKLFGDTLPPHFAIFGWTMGGRGFKSWPRVPKLWVWLLSGWGRCLKVTLQKHFHSCWCGDEWMVKPAQKVSEDGHRREWKLYSSMTIKLHFFWPKRLAKNTFFT